MKRVIALALALVLSLSMGVIAFADDKEAPLELNTGKPADGVYNYLAPNQTYKYLIQVINPADGTVVLDPVSAAKAYFDDSALKCSFKATKGSEYVKSYEFKKSGLGQLYLELKTVELYLGKIYDIEWEIKVTFTKPGKIGEKLYAARVLGEGNGYATAGVVTGAVADKWYGTYKVVNNKVTLDKAGALKNNDYVLQKYLKYKFGWWKEIEVNKESNDLDFPADTAFKPYRLTDSTANVAAAATTDENEDARLMHIKKGTGDNYTMTFDDTAYLEVKMSDQAAINMFYSEAAVKAITSKYADTDFLFYNWRGNPTFDFTADIELYVDEDEVGEDPVLYFWDNVNLTKVDADYDDETFAFRTRQLGCYVVASKALDTSVAPVETTAAAGEAATTAAGTGNPRTGVSDFVGVAVALAVVSMAAAGAVALKK